MNLNAIESRAVDVNGILLHAQDLLRRGNTEKAEALINEARSLNWENRRALLEAGAADSIKVEADRIRG